LYSGGPTGPLGDRVTGVDDRLAERGSIDAIRVIDGHGLGVEVDPCVVDPLNGGECTLHGGLAVPARHFGNCENSRHRCLLYDFTRRSIAAAAASLIMSLPSSVSFATQCLMWSSSSPTAAFLRAPVAALLHRLYTVHVTVLPMMFLFLVAAHLMLVKRHRMAPSPFRKGPTPEPIEPFSRHLARLGGFALVIVGALTVLAVVIPPSHGPSPVAGIEITKPPWPMLWIYPIENWTGVAGILWGTLAIFAALLIVPFVDRGREQLPTRRLAVVIPAAVIVVVIVALIAYAAVTPVASHIE